ncbi:MAG: non-homologous end-joining DNA ligase [Actinomycetota bacterium]
MRVTNPYKLLFPADGITKGAVVAHYQALGSAMVEFVAGRPLTLQRFPRGIGSKGFMQKNAADHFPPSIRRLPVPKRGGGETVYPVVDQADDLAYLANQNTITFHMWTSSADHPGRPDWLVMDLDPEAGDTDSARAATLTIRRVLETFGLRGQPVATGSKGFHVWVPLRSDGGETDGFGAVALASRALAGLAVAAEPDRLTTEFLKRNRKGRVFVDWLRNGPTATVVVPFSLRPRAGAPVATPLTWDEVPTTDPDHWRLDTIGERPSIQWPEPQDLPVADIEEAARAAGVDLDTPHDRFGRDR